MAGPAFKGPQYQVNNGPSAAQQQLQDQMARSQQFQNQSAQRVDQMQQTHDRSDQNSDELHGSMQNDMQRIRSQMRAGPGYSGLGQGVPGL